MLLRTLVALLFLILIKSGDVELNPGPGLRDKPTEIELTSLEYTDERRKENKIRIINNVAANWRTLGILLEFSSEDLANIRRNNRDVEDCCQDLLDRWLREAGGKGPVTWERLVKAIEEARYGELARKLREALSCEGILHQPDVVPGSGLHLLPPNFVPDPASYWKLLDCKYKGSRTFIAVVDTGIQDTHPAFAGRQFEAALIDSCGHGTFVAGVACGAPFQGVHQNGSTVKCRGVAPKASLVIRKACDNYEPPKNLVPDLKNLIHLIHEGHIHVDVVVISSGFADNVPGLHEAIKKLDQQNVIIVCAASNEGARDKTAICYPACYPETICVGSHDQCGNRSGFSPIGEEMDFLALGENVYGPNYDFENHHKQGYKDYLLASGSGTSIAAPAIGGLICLILEAVADKCPDKLDQIHTGYAMKKLLQKLTRGAPHNHSDGYGSITRDQVMHFFKDPKPFIDMLVREKVIR